MDYCKYHPLSPATYYCHNCAIGNCNCCINDDINRGEPRCFLCESELESLGGGNTVEPFWRRLQEAFKYPLNGNAIAIIVGVSLGSAMLTVMGFSIITLVLSLSLTGVILKYSFVCMEHTAQGDMTAPDVTEAYVGGMGLLLQLFAMLVITGGALGLVGNYLGVAIAGILALLFFVSIPAILIRFTQTSNLIEALNPLANIQLMAAIGFPYGVLLAFLMIMMGSVGVVNQVIGADFSFISNLLSSLVGNYYFIVSFHIMGYMVFQYQDRLGFSASIDGEEQGRSEVDRLTSCIDVNLKEGDYSKVAELYSMSFKLFPSNMDFYDRYFGFIQKTENRAKLVAFADTYLNALSKNRRYERLAPTYKQITLMIPEYMPATPGLRVELARANKNSGDPKTAVKLLNKLAKQHPEYPGLAKAYTLLAESLDDIPNMQAQSEKCRKLVSQLQNSDPGQKQDVGSDVGQKDKRPKAAHVGESEVAKDKLGNPLEPVSPKKSGPENQDANDLPPINFKL